MRLLLLLFLISISSLSFAQFGVAFKYNANDFKEHNDTFNSLFPDSDDLHATGLAVGLNYWFRLKNQRIEFLPELEFANFKTNEFNQLISDPSPDSNISSYAIGLNLNTQVYILDFLGDCDCPTWGKDGGFFQKGFFFAISPGIYYQYHEVNTTGFGSVEPNELKETTNNIVYKLGLGLGLDVGVTKLLTISPFVNYNYFLPISNQFVFNTCPTCNYIESSNPYTQLQAGIRLSFRPDYKF